MGNHRRGGQALMRLTFEQVSAIAHPEYYRGERPCVRPDQVSDNHWKLTSRVGGDELLDQYDGLIELQRSGELIRDVSLVREDDEPALMARIKKLEGDVEQLRYERRLLGFARRVLDMIADPECRYTRQEIEPGAADVAQRIVDEIGHPATEEDALGPSFRDQLFRVRMLAAWTDATKCGVGGKEMLALLVDERSNDAIRLATERTGHRIGCRCERCLDVAQAGV